MVYYKDYRLTIIETDGKYTLYDAKYGGRAVHQNKTKEWTDDYIQRVSKLRGRRKPTMAAVQKPKYEINVVGDSEIESVHHIRLSYDGNYYSVIFGKYMNGGFCSIPNWGIGCELSFDFKDVFWNEESLYKVLKRKGASKAIALAIAEFEDRKEVE